MAARGWEALWAVFFGLLAFPALLAGDALGLLWVALKCGVGYLACRLFTTRLGSVGHGLVVAVAAILLGVVVEASVYERAWNPTGDHLREGIAWSKFWGVDRVSHPESFREWTLPDAPGPLRLSFEARRVEGQPGWSWRTSGPNVVMRQAQGRDVLAARLEMPVDGEPWVARDYGVSSPVSAIRVAVDLRSYRPAMGRLVLLADGETVHEVRVGLREELRRVTTTWRAAELARPDVVTVKLTDFAGHTLFARNVRVEAAPEAGVGVPGTVTGEGAVGGGGADGGADGWRSLDLPQQARASVGLARVDGDPMLGEPAPFLPTPKWQPVSATFAYEQLGSLEEARTILRLEPETELALRNVRLESAKSAAPARARGDPLRKELWYGHPNLMGHGVAVAGLAMAATLPVGGMGVLGVIIATVATAYTKGRAALVVLVVGVLALWLLRSQGRPRLRATIAILLALMVAAGTAYVVVVGSSREEAGQLPRAAIASVAVQAIEEAPWTGNGGHPDAFLEVWQEHGVPNELPVHAHNWWLQQGVAHGIPGIVAATWFSLVLLGIAWRAGRWRGAVLVLGVLALQVFDVTLLHWSVFSPLVLAVNALARPGEVHDIPVPEPAMKG